MDNSVSPDQLIAEAKEAYERADYLTAAHTYQDVAQSFESAGDRVKAAEMKNNSSVAFLRGGEAEEAFREVNGTDDVFAEFGNISRQGMALGNIGAALEGMKRFEEAVEVYKQSAELLKEAGEHESRAKVMQSLSGLQLRTGNQFEAITSMRNGIDGLEKPSFIQRLYKKILQLSFKIFSR